MDTSGNLSRGTGHLKDNHSFTMEERKSSVIMLFRIVTGPKVIPSSWIVMPVSLVSLRVPTLRILFGRNLRNSFTLSDGGEILKSIQRSVCVRHYIQASFPICLHLESQLENRRKERNASNRSCRIIIRSSRTKPLKLCGLRNGSFSFIKCEVHSALWELTLNVWP